MANTTITVQVSVAWRLKSYIYCIVLSCWLTGQAPNMDKVAYWVSKAVKVE